MTTEVGITSEEYAYLKPWLAAEFSVIDERLTHIESQLTEMYEIFCKLYQAYTDMASSPMFAALVGRMGK